MDTYFARHTEALDVDQWWVDRLWDARRIAVHYPEGTDGQRGPVDNTSTDPADHAPAGARVMRALTALAAEGGYVCAQYRGHDPCLVGKVPSGTAIEPMPGEWRRSSYPAGRPAALKTVRLTAVREVSPVAHAALLAGRPQRGTFTRWPNAGDAVEALVEGWTLAPSLDRLSPAQQEVLCAEFLRTDDAAALGLPRLARLLLPTGRTLKDLDVYGLAADGRPLCAQVTHAPLATVAWKVERLRAYGRTLGCPSAAAGPDAHLVLFCRTGAAADVVAHGDVHVVSIDAVFARVAASSWGRAWLGWVLSPGSLSDGA